MTEKRLHSMPLKDIHISDNYWSRYIDTIFEKGIAYQWETLNDRVADAEPSYCINNYMIAAGRKQGEFGGMVFQDSDLSKWLEAVAYSLEIRPNPDLEALADWSIDLIGDAQCEDGYVDTYFTVKEPGRRFTDLTEGHELYIAGHMIEAAVAYYNATGKDKFLNIVRRFADLICETFGDGEGQISGYPGHPEIELALMKLSDVTGDPKYMKTAKFFVDRRGGEPNFFTEELKTRGNRWIFPEMAKFDMKYYQNHAPIREQDSAEGHAVRNLYLYTGVADVAFASGDQSLLDACKRIFDNIAERRMYITGSVGSAGFGERFSCDYDLPNHSNYSESCASIALAMFCKRMLEIEKDGRYADVMENALYNTTLAGMNLDGDRFFYVNPLEVDPEACKKNTDLAHVKPVRQTWFGCACCPPNIVRTLASLGQYIYSAGEDELYVNLYVSNQTSCSIGGRDARISVASGYPFDGAVKVAVESTSGEPFTLALRVPKWTTLKKLTVGGEELKGTVIEKGYLKLHRSWEGRTEILLELEMPARLVYANPKVRADVGRAAVVKGPVVYCLEEADNGKNLPTVEIPADAVLEEVYEEGLLGGTMTIRTKGTKLDTEAWGRELYQEKRPERVPAELKFIPYCLWDNRGEGEMAVWVRYKDE